MNGPTELTEIIAIGELPRDLAALLENAKEAVVTKKRLDGDPEAVLTYAQRKAKQASQLLTPGSRDSDALRKLSDANAFVVAAASAPEIERFPQELPVKGLIPLANLYGSLGREHEARERLEDALQRYLSGLYTLTTYRVYRPWNEVVGKITFWLMLRAATVVGVLAAHKGLKILDALKVLGTNMEPFMPLLGDEGDFQVPRSACALAYARQRLSQMSWDADVAGLKEEINAVALEVEPMAPLSKVRFSNDLQSVLAQIDLRLRNTRPVFHWS